MLALGVKNETDTNARELPTPSRGSRLYTGEEKMNGEMDERGECGPLEVDAHKLGERGLEANLSSEGFMTRGDYSLWVSVVFGLVSHGR